MKNTNQKSLLVVASMMILATGGLVAMNASSPGFCPNYPILNLPACWVMEGYFLIMLLALFIKDTTVSKVLYYVPGIIAFASGIMFSVKEIMDLSQCPRLFDIPFPLCFSAPPVIALLLYLKYKGDKA